MESGRADMPLWTTILKQAPVLIAAADALLARSRAAPAAAAPADDAPVLRRRIAALEQQQQAQADLVKQLAEQVAALTIAAQAGAARARQATLVGSAGLGLALVAAVLALVLR